MIVVYHRPLPVLCTHQRSANFFLFDYRQVAVQLPLLIKSSASVTRAVLRKMRLILNVVCWLWSTDATHLMTISILSTVPVRLCTSPDSCSLPINLFEKILIIIVPDSTYINFVKHISSIMKSCTVHLTESAKDNIIPQYVRRRLPTLG